MEYADLLDNFIHGLNNQMLGVKAANIPFILEDETEYHLGIGFSWVVGYNNMIHVRAGGYTDPDHSLLSSGRLASPVALLKRPNPPLK